jgi:O-antigen/teichoic acid export membrane protein
VVITIPVFINTLGADAYGVFSLVALAGSLNVFANLGLNASLTRFLAQQGKTAESDLDIAVTIILQLIVLTPLTAVGLVARGYILTDILRVPPSLMGDAKWLFTAMLLGSVLLLIGQTFTSMLDAQQKIHLTSLYLLIYNVLYWGLILLVVYLGYALHAVAIVVFASAVAWFCIVTTSSLRAWGGLSLAGFRSNMLRIAKKQLSYGLQMYVSGVVGFFYEPFTKILVSRFIGVTEVGLFDIGLRMRNQITGLATKLIYPLFPMLSLLKDEAKTRFIVHDVEQKTFFVVVPLTAAVILISGPVSALFFTTHVRAIAITVACIASSFLVASVTVTPMYLFMMAKGHASKTIIIQLTNVVVNAVVFFALLAPLAYYSAVVANVAAIFSSFLVSLYYQKRYLDSLIFDSPTQLFRMVLTFAFAIALAYGIGRVIQNDGWEMVLLPIVVGTVSIVLYRYARMVQQSDIERYLGENSQIARLAILLLCKVPATASRDRA